MAFSPHSTGISAIEAAYETLGQLIQLFKPAASPTAAIAAPASTAHSLRPAAVHAPRRYRTYIKYPIPHGKKRPPAHSGAYKIADLCKAYDFPTGLAGGGTIGILELSTPGSDASAYCGYTQADLDQFSELNGLPTIKVTDVSVNGGENKPGGDGDAEVLLDIQVAAATYFYATGHVPTIKVFFAPNESSSFAAVFKAAAEAGCDVLSISWGGDEAGWTKADADQLEAAAQDATSKGCVLFAASGDNSSGDGGSGANVDLPAACPHVIGCGGTKKTSTSEVVWGDGKTNGEGTGGGYSIYFPPQEFQLNAPPSPGKAGRMVPDVAADAAPATGYMVVVNGQEMPVGGTSAVAPLYSGLFAAFGTKLGFVTPTLWKNPHAFVDITEGSNGDYKASVGPDPCTGLGAPIGTALAALFVSSASSPTKKRHK